MSTIFVSSSPPANTTRPAPAARSNSVSRELPPARQTLLRSCCGSPWMNSCAALYIELPFYNRDSGWRGDKIGRPYQAAPNLVPDRSETCESLWTVVGNLDAGDLHQRTVRLSGVANQLRSIPVDLIEKCAIRRYPAIGGAAGHRSVQPPGSAVPRNPRARGIARNFQAAAIDVVAADVAVAEVRCVYRSIIGRDCQPTQLGRHARARVDLYERADVDRAVLLDGAHGASIPDGVSDDESIRLRVQERD